jgi:hypothetical protein
VRISFGNRGLLWAALEECWRSVGVPFCVGLPYQNSPIMRRVNSDIAMSEASSHAGLFLASVTQVQVPQEIGS